MAYCKKCGNYLSDDSKFCSSCGTATNSDDYGQRKNVYDGEVHKCPNCGEIINAFVSICPSCGFEINGKNVSSALQDFIKQIFSDIEE